MSFICPAKNTTSDVNFVHNVMLEAVKYVLDVLNCNNIENMDWTFLGRCSVCHAKEALDISRRDTTNDELVRMRRRRRRAGVDNLYEIIKCRQRRIGGYVLSLSNDRMAHIALDACR